MIVVAIIGILAAIALPAYQDYTKRAHVTEGLQLASAAKLGISEYYASEGSWPTKNADVGLPEDATAVAGNAVKSVTIATTGEGEDTKGTITILFNEKVKADKKIVLTATATNATTATALRKLSPQRLTHYRDNWYLDAWCHQKDALRTFALDRISALHLHKTSAKKISQKILNQHYTPSFGIFGGQADNIAVLKFTPHRSQWVAEEIWHHKQTGTWLDDGSYQLEIPYGNDLELIGDILKYGDQVEVIAPRVLREKVIKRLRNMLELY